MIKLITKERYYKILGVDHYEDYSVFNSVYLSENKWEKFICNGGEYYCVYFLIEELNSVFVYFYSLHTLLIPNMYKNIKEIYEKILTSDTTLDNWEIKLQQKIEPTKHKYLLNTFKVGKFYNFLESPHSVLRNGNDDYVFISGKYEITNKDFPEDRVEFSLRNNLHNEGSYWKTTYVAFPEKSDLFFTNVSKMLYIENLIAVILNSNGRNYQEPYIKS